MSSSPQVASQTAELAATSESTPAWKQEVNARLSAHRSRRGAFDARQPALPGMENSSAPAERTARVAARVAERYAKAPTYSEVLAAEAARAARAAEAAAHAAHQAHQAAQAVTDVLWAQLESNLESGLESRAGSGLDREAGNHTTALQTETAPAQPSQYRVDPASLPAARRNQASRSSQPLPELRLDVDPHPHVVDPFEDALVAPPQPLPARVLEFPRELVAARKARPRFAEGPLRDPEGEPEKAQLRIFEVESEAICHQPIAPTEEARLPEWSSMRLDATPRFSDAELSATSFTGDDPMQAMQSSPGTRSAPFSSRASRQSSSTSSRAGAAGHPSRLADTLLLHVAPIEDRLMAAIVDMALVLCAFLLFVLVFAACTIHPPTGKPAMVAAAAALACLVALYQWLFFTYAEGTPGMRYAKIALCTFEDENPGRKALQQRVGACFLAALPLGLGFLWALLDDDRLGWHDRMTRTYQRSYK